MLIDNSKTNEFPIGSLYGREDSRDVRKAFFGACKAQKAKPARRQIISSKEWKKFEKAGLDMSKFLTIGALRKEERQRQMKEFKERAHAKIDPCPETENF